jgi:DNA modification methylase
MTSRSRRSTPRVRILVGDVFDRLSELPEESVHLCVTSPPYWGLRDYSVEPRAYGGDPGCEHEWGVEERGKRKDLLPSSETRSTCRTGTDERQGRASVTGGRRCGRCGAWLGCLGKEPMPAEWCARQVEVFRLVRRLLRPDGSLFVNVGDCYSRGKLKTVEDCVRGGKQNSNMRGERRAPGYKDGDRVLLGPMFAEAMRVDGWHLCQQIVWAKAVAFAESGDVGSCIPESVDGWRWVRCRRKLASARSCRDESLKQDGHGPRHAEFNARWKESQRKPSGWNVGHDAPDDVGRYLDNRHEAVYEDCPGCDRCRPNDGLVLRRGRLRPVNSYEYLYQFSKGPRPFGDREAVREPASASSLARIAQPTFDLQTGGPKDYRKTGVNPSQSCRKALENFRRNPGRTPRAVWRINPEPTRLCHFATYPQKLVEPCVAGWTSEAGCCAACGAPWARVVERTPEYQELADKFSGWSANPETEAVRLRTGVGMGHPASLPPANRTLGFRPTCGCPPADPVPCTVLDPYLGTGTTLLVASRMGRDGVGVELNPEYAEMARQRIADDAPLLGVVVDSIPEGTSEDGSPAQAPAALRPARRPARGRRPRGGRRRARADGRG